VLQDSQTEKWDTKAVQQEGTFYYAGTDLADSSPKAKPQEQRGFTLYTLQAGYRSKKQGLTDIWLHATLLATSPPPP
jgi:hypothetical protein